MELGSGLFMYTSVNQDTIVNVSRISCQNESEKIKFLPINNGPFSSRPKPLLQSEAKCKAIDLKITLICARKVLYLASF